VNNRIVAELRIACALVPVHGTQEMMTMQRANDLIGVAIVFIGTLAGCRQGASPSDPGGRVASNNAAFESKALPEIVITASRPRSRTIVLSARGAEPVRH
jgi:hypothetical protein